MKQLVMVLGPSGLLVLIMLSTLITAETEVKRGRDPKLFNILNIVRFPNDACNTGGSRNGTCYTKQECEDRGGTEEGDCADGFGVCCSFKLDCGERTSENCTYFEVNNPSAGECTATICPCNDNICQLRLDFQSFTISGPNTITDTQFTVLHGVPSAATNARNANTNTQCNTDVFSVSSPGNNNPPSICGTNTGEHMYVDSSESCNDLAFLIGSAASTTRQWSVKVTQYSCDYENLAPDGCTQYYFGANTNDVKSYNFDGSHQLANQNQAVCVRRERGQCRICWTAIISTEFDLSDRVDAGNTRPNSGTSCCGYGTDGRDRDGYDCVIIPGAQKTTTAAAMNNAPSRQCGRGQGLRTNGGTNKSICSTMQPFLLRFMSDSFEYSGNNQEGTTNDRGFRLAYVMDSIGC